MKEIHLKEEKLKDALEYAISIIESIPDEVMEALLDSLDEEIDFARLYFPLR